MANYRRKLEIRERKLIHSTYKNHTDDDGGIFKKDKRRKLLGLKQSHGKYFEDTSDFWYDVRSTVKSGLKDLELFFDVAHPEQIKEVFYDSPNKEEIEILKKIKNSEKIYESQRQITSLTQTLRTLFRPHHIYKKFKTSSGDTKKYSEQIEEDEWKAYLVEKIIKICIQYLENQHLISSKAHQRLTEEFEDMVKIEITRGVKLPRDQRVMGSV